LIGDTSAVSPIIKDYEHSHNRHYQLEALGRLATPEAVDFIIDHLEDYGATDALFASKSKKALPALEKHLGKLKQNNSPDVAIDLAATRIAIIRLSKDDCREALLQIAEDQKEDHHARWDAFEALEAYDTSSFTKRILEVYKRDPDTSIKRICIWLLQDSKFDGVTEALMDHALQAEKIKSKDDLATEDALLQALNQRLGTVFPDMKELRTHIREIRK
jgi:hypothetical protein